MPKYSIPGGCVTNRFFGRDSEARDGIETELGLADLSPDDRKEYEDAFGKIEETIEKEDGS
jgi:hypothetical protein